MGRVGLTLSLGVGGGFGSAAVYVLGVIVKGGAGGAAIINGISGGVAFA